MTGWGWILITLGVIAALWGVAMDAAAPGTSILNLGLLGQKQALVTIGADFFLGGVVLIAAGAIREQLRSFDLGRSAGNSSMPTISNDPNLPRFARVKHPEFGDGVVMGVAGEFADVYFGRKGDYRVSISSLEKRPEPPSQKA